MSDQVVYYYDKEGVVRIRGGDPLIEVRIYYDGGIKVNYVRAEEDSDLEEIEELTKNISKVRLTEEQKRNMPDKYVYNKNTGKMNIRRLEKKLEKMNL